MRVFTAHIPVRTTRRFQIIDISADVKRLVAESGIREGTVTVFSPHTTCAIRINENEPRLHQDMERFLTEICPQRGAWRHDVDTVDDRPNAWGHVLSLLMNASATIPLSEGAMALGGWQSVFFVELDGPRETRTVHVHLMGV